MRKAARGGRKLRNSHWRANSVQRIALHALLLPPGTHRPIGSADAGEAGAALWISSHEQISLQI